MKAPLDSQVRIPQTAGRLVSTGATDSEIRYVEVQLQIVRQTVVQFEIGRILAQIRVLKLKGVVLIEKLKMPLSTIGHASVVGIERQLRMERLACGERTRQRQPKQNTQGEMHRMSIQNSPPIGVPALNRRRTQEFIMGEKSTHWIAPQPAKAAPSRLQTADRLVGLLRPANPSTNAAHSSSSEGR